MSKQGRINTAIALGLLGAGAALYGWAVNRELKKQAGIDRWVEAEREGIEIERKEKGL